MKFLLPKQNHFYSSLIKINESLKEIAALLCVFAKEFKDFSEYAKKAKEIEHNADDATHEIIDLLNKTFITPFDREDIYLLAHELDDIVDLIENVVNNVLLYGIKTRPPALEEFSLLIKEAAENLDHLLHLLEKQSLTEEMKSTKIKIHELEDKGDSAYNKATTELFEKGTDPILIMKMKDILDGLEDTMDKFQKVSQIIEGIIVKAA